MKYFNSFFSAVKHLLNFAMLILIVMTKQEIIY